MEYYAIINNQQVGPMSKLELSRSCIAPDTMVWHEGLADWVKASEVATLSDLFIKPETPATVNDSSVSVSEEGPTVAQPNEILNANYRNRIGQSIAALIGCMVLSGIAGAWPAIFALINAIKGNRFYQQGDIDQAVAFSNKAHKQVVTAWILSIVLFITLVLLFVFVVPEDVVERIAHPYNF